MADTTKPTTHAGPRVDRVTGKQSAPDASAPAGVTAGRTIVADHVVAKVAGIAAREVPGVFALGSGGARTLGAIRDAINATDLTQGVKVEVGETQAAVDVTIVVEYPSPIHTVSAQVRTAIARAVSELAGLEVVEVNIAVDDVHLPSEDAESDDGRVA